MAPRPRYRSVVQDSARWDGFPWRDGDIVICTPPKSGTTWTQAICALLIFQTPDLPAPLSDLSPWMDMLIRPKEEVWARLEAQTHRRFIKTHTPLDGLPFDERVTYLCVGRDPRDAAISGEHHGANMDVDLFFAMRAAVVGDEDDLQALDAINPPPPDDDPRTRFWHWVENPTPPVHLTGSLASSLHHAAVALAAQDRDNVVPIHYARLKADLEGEMRRIAGRLGIAVPEALWPTLVDAATFARMRERADIMAPDAKTGIWKENAGFFHSGRTGQWRDFFDDAAQARYDARVAALATPDVAAWVHQD